ncbi:MAG: S8 family serine peptidase [Chitinophagales bacterium]|nr:S8 family serine peptidase [Chitinophagales bacterium]
MVRAIVTFLFSCFLSVVLAQQATKLDLRLWLRLQNGDVRNSNMSLLVQGNPAAIKQLTEQYGGIYKTGIDDISSIEIPEKSLIKFSENPAVVKIENTQAKGTLLMDTARLRNNIDSVHSGFAPLTDSLKGKGVIVGIIDGGIYWQHMDFRNNDANNTTRIRYIWDQVVTGSPAPLPYNYGRQCDWFDLNSNSCFHVPPSSDFGHGTCVAGIAAGNSNSTLGTAYAKKLKGVAPQAEIIAVRVKNDQNFLANVADAVDYIFKKADAMGKPCVINTSIGTYYGSHDAQDLSSKMIDALLAQRNGRVLVAAAGNAGEIKHHLSYSIPSDSAYTYFKFNATYNEVYFDLWADTADFNNAYFLVGCSDKFGTELGRIPYLNVLTDFPNLQQGVGIIKSQTLTGLGNINMQVTLDGGRYHVEFLVYPTVNSHLWRLQTKGSGKFDLWSSAALIGSADMVSQLETGDTANPFAYIQSVHYRHPDTLKTMVSSWQNSDRVITVGNYSNRAGYLDRDGNYVDLLVPPYNEVVGKRFSTSSFGPTRDMRLKPDIMATGSTTIATGEAAFIAAATSASNRVKVYITQKHIRNGGTSMASPIVAGIAALYLQKRPTATYEEIKQAIICTAVKDNFTGQNAGYEYGNGKVNAFAALTRANCIVFGVKDTACLNYTPLATVDTGGCVAKVYGCMDSTALNYNPLANIADGSCSYSIGINNISTDGISVAVVPNPFGSTATFILRNANTAFVSGEIKIINQLGETVDAFEVNTSATTYTYRNTKLAAGIYYYLLVAQNKTLAGGKLVIEKH